MSKSLDPTEVDRYPTTEEIQDLPDHVRKYIHDLEARCDPARDVRRLDAQKQKIRELQADNERLRKKVIDQYEVALYCCAYMGRLCLWRHYGKSLARNG